MTQHKQPTWRDARQNLVKLVEDRPAMLLDAIDAAYLAGLDNKHALFTSLISWRERLDAILPLLVEDHNNFIAEAGEIGELDIEDSVRERIAPFIEAELSSLISQLEGMKQDNVDGAEFSTYTAARNSTLSDAQELIRNNYLQ